jgi:hypothetical protein
LQFVCFRQGQKQRQEQSQETEEQDEQKEVQEEGRQVTPITVRSGAPFSP